MPRFNRRNLPVRQNRAMQAKTDGFLASGKLPEYLEYSEVESLLANAPHGKARFVMLCQWRAGLRIAEALKLTPADVYLDTDMPTLKVRMGKGGKDRIVPVHPRLKEAFLSRLQYSEAIALSKPFVSVNPSTTWRWVKEAYRRAIILGVLPPGKKIGTHTLRHSAARHWLANGVPINKVSIWLGHASIQTTLIYLRILPDAAGDMERVP